MLRQRQYSLGFSVSTTSASDESKLQLVGAQATLNSGEHPLHCASAMLLSSCPFNTLALGSLDDYCQICDADAVTRLMA